MADGQVARFPEIDRTAVRRSTALLPAFNVKFTSAASWRAASPFARYFRMRSAQFVAMTSPLPGSGSGSAAVVTSPATNWNTRNRLPSGETA